MEHPFLDETFEIPWNQLRPEHIEADIEAGLEQAQAALNAIAAEDYGGLTFENTLVAFEAANQVIERGWGRVGHLDSVLNSPALREAYNKMLPRVSAFHSQIYLNEKLWKAISTYADTPEAQSLQGARKRLLEETLLDFRESGADLSRDAKERLEAIDLELATLNQKFSENVLDSTNAWEQIIDKPDDLRGLPESALAAAREDALAKGQGSEEAPRWRLTLHATSMLPVMKYAEEDALRKSVWEGSCAIGHTPEHDNTDLIRKIIRLRQEKAELLGKSHYPDLATARRMAKSGQNALQFVEDLHQRVKHAFLADFAEIEAFKKEQTGQDGRLEPWETAFWSERLRHTRYELKEEDLRPYFPLHRVKEGLFEIAEQLFGISIRQRATRYIDPASGQETLSTVKGNNAPPFEVWHPEVGFFELRDTDGTLLGGFYTDWHPRESKRSGAWMNYLRTGGPLPDGGFAPHLGLMCGNMSKPSGGKPALMTHDEVLTIFHEFGHLLHHLLGRVEIKSLNGVNVAWDFVELPSQLMENWCWEREALDRFARHYETGERIPDALFERMLAARNFQEGAFTMRQLSLAKLDLELHLYPQNYAEGDLDAALGEALADYSYPYKTQPPSIARRFTHLFSGGYAAGYYSYKWAEVLDADAFTRFQKEGVLNRETGLAFRRSILEKGNSEPPEKLFHDFMGREADPAALLRRAGLA